MTHEQPHTGKGRIWLWLLIPLIVLSIGAGARWSLQSDWLLEKVRAYAERQANEQLLGSLSIGALDGDLLYGFNIRNIELLGPERERVATLDSVTVSYSLFKLLREPLRVDRADLFGLMLESEQADDGSWSFGRLIREPPAPDPAEQRPISWSIGELSLSDSRVELLSHRFPDGKLTLGRLELRVSETGVQNEVMFGELRQLRFVLEETRFIQPVEVGTSARFQEREFSLEQLVVNTGRTWIEGGMRLTGDATIDGELTINPLSWRDLTAYADLPLEQDLEVSVAFRGSLQEFHLELDASSHGLGQLRTEISADLGDPPTLKQLSFHAEGFNTPLVTGDSLMPQIGRFALTGEGDLPLTDPESGTFTFRFDAEEVESAGLNVEWLKGELEWSDAVAVLALELHNGNDRVHGSVTASRLFTDQPEWEAGVEISGVNLATWLKNEVYESDLTMTLAIRGRGAALSDEQIQFEAAATDSRWGDLALSEVRFQGTLSDEQIAGRLQAEGVEGRFDGSFTIEGWQSDPVYDFTANIREVNLAEFPGLEEFPTDLNAGITGRGTGFNPETVELSAEIVFDSSSVNREQIEKLQARFELREQVIYLTDTELSSPVADATITMRHHLVDMRDPDNRLELNAGIKRIDSLSPLFGVDELQAHGTVSGSVFRQADGELALRGQFDLEEIIFDTLFTSDRVEGELEGVLLNEPELTLSVAARLPATSGLTLQSARLDAFLVMKEVRTEGNIRFELVESDEYGLRHEGAVQYSERDLYLLTEHLEVDTPFMGLALVSPFELTWREGLFQMERMRIVSDNGEAFLELAVPYLDDVRQEFVMEARTLDLGVIQRALLEEAVAEAFLSGHLRYMRQGTELETDADLHFSEIRMADGRMDSLRAGISVRDGRLLASSSGWIGQDELFSFRGDIPFEPADPLTLDEEFFQKPVSGHFQLNRTSIRFWNEFLPPEQRIETSGEILFIGEVGGSAGIPEFNGELTIHEGEISGVMIDSLKMGIDYSHEEQTIGFDGYVESLGTRIARFDGLLPLYIDLQRFVVELPQESDEIRLDLTTDTFQLALLNDFLDRDLFRDLRGTVSGQVEIRGTVGSPEPLGTMTLSGGSLRVVPSGINLTDIRSELRFQRDHLQLHSFSMRSGPGQFTASGSVELVELQPGNLNIQFRANQFRVANTSEMNAILDLNGSLIGTVESPEIRGVVSLRSGFVNLQNFGDTAIEQVQLEDDEEQLSGAFYDAMTIDMAVEFNRQFFIRNRQYLDMEVELLGTVDLQKRPGEDLQMFGSVEGVRGYARPMGRNFVLEDAAVTFFGPIDNPELRIRTLYRPPQQQEDISIWYLIEGTVLEPEFSFDSDPFLEFQDIISYTIFGQPFYALESWKQVVATGSGSSTAADVAIELLLDRVEMLATQQLGIDVVQIDNSRSGSNSTTSIKTGWFLNERTFFAISNEISTTPKTLFILEYMLRRNLELIITQGDDLREGVDLRWRFDY